MSYLYYQNFTLDYFIHYCTIIIFRFIDNYCFKAFNFNFLSFHFIFEKPTTKDYLYAIYQLMINLDFNFLYKTKYC
jgi:hypothetical protein